MAKAKPLVVDWQLIDTAIRVAMPLMIEHWQPKKKTHLTRRVVLLRQLEPINTFDAVQAVNKKLMREFRLYSETPAADVLQLLADADPTARNGYTAAARRDTVYSAEWAARRLIFACLEDLTPGLLMKTLIMLDAEIQADPRWLKNRAALTDQAVSTAAANRYAMTHRRKHALP